MSLKLRKRFGVALLMIVASRCWAAEPLAPDQPTQQALAQMKQRLVQALQQKDEATVRKLTAESAVLLGTWAGVPEVADEYRPSAEGVEPLTRVEASAGHARILPFVQRQKWWKIGLDPTETEHLPREAATCLVGCLAGWRADAPNKDALLNEAVEAGDYLLWTQQQAGTGVIPFPAYRKGRNKAFEAAERFLQHAERAGRMHEVVRNGWAFEDFTDGGLQFDNGSCGVALLELYEATKETRFLQAAVAAADWAVGRPCVTNWNYNSFSVYLLAGAYRVTHEAKYREAAKEKARLGILPGQLQAGRYQGRWADQHNARPAYHYIMIRGLTALWAVLPADDADREPITSAIRMAMQTRNAEFVSRGIMNVDSALEALLLFKSLPADKQQAVGACRVDEAFSVLERHCADRLRKNQPPFSPGVGGRYFEYVLRRNP